ncbi:MAG: ATP-binding cassette domain-containing protein [Zoogloeaceae bacterium]|jgi:ATP-binding cassette subfamily F protein 3|nr:ATP-binding cassette domain-containing protein [Zoogloeaceae bacterium]
MIALKQLTLARAGKPLIEGADLQIHPGWRVGLIGANGAGKSSLFALLAGELHPEKGDLLLPPSWIIARVRQETPALPDAALDFVLEGDAELTQLERDIAAAEQAGVACDGEHLAHLHARYGDIGGYSARARAAEVLHGLGFVEADFARPVAEFSGGWRVRLNLARALFCRADLLLLDEPTNHLDLDAVLWLEGWLKNTPATLLLISHDRDFLDAVVGRVLAIEQQRLTLYSGGYSDYEAARAERLAAQQATFVAQQRRIAHLNRFIERFKAKATKARQAQSRIKALARMETVAAAHVDSPFSFVFSTPDNLPDPLLVVHQGATGYGGRTLLSGLELTLRPGCRIGLLGRNGAGKSTLIKLLAGELPLMAGEKKEAKALSIGYFAQHQLEQLRPDESPLQHLLRQEPKTPEQALRDYLGGFDFRGDMASGPTANFSGGEKSRLALALLLRRQPNLLLLDEPTNHLDLEMREALCLALQDYPGGVVLVSHDRHLLRAATDELWKVSDGQAAPFEGDLDDYAIWLNACRNAEKTAPSPGGNAAPEPQKNERRQQRAIETAARQERLQRRRPLLKELEALEKQLATLNADAQTLATALLDPALYSPDANRQTLTTLLHRQRERQETLDAAELRWLELHAALEHLPELER